MNGLLMQGDWIACWVFSLILELLYLEVRTYYSGSIDNGTLSRTWMTLWRLMSISCVPLPLQQTGVL